MHEQNPIENPSGRQVVRCLIRAWLASPGPIVIPGDGRGAASRASLYRPHLHTVWEVKLLLRGRMLVELADATLELQAPGCLLMPPHRVHASDHAASESPDLCRLACVIEHDIVDISWQGVGDAATGQLHDLAAPDFSAAWAADLPAHPNEVIQQVARLHGSESEEDRCYAAHLMHIWAAALARTLTRAGRDGHEHPLLTRALAIIRSEYHDPELTVKAMADRLRVSKEYLCHLFRRHLNASVRQTLIAYRLERARELLLRGFYRVNEVSRLTGWSSPSYFSRVYADRYGYPPKAERRTASAAPITTATAPATAAQRQPANQ